MTKYSDLFFRQGKLTRLDFFNDETFDSFETATNEIIKSFYNDLKTLRFKYDDLESKISDNYDKRKTYETEEQSDLIDNQLYIESQSEYINVYLNSLVEMKLLYLFKSLELSIKYLIGTAYPDTGVKSLFKWENMKDFFKNREMDITTINGYLECVELKKVNNCIKHNGNINEEIQSIVEFRDQPYLKHEDLEIFYNRIKQKVKMFCTTAYSGPY